MRRGFGRRTPYVKLKIRKSERLFTPICKTRYAKLLPFWESIGELRDKAASYDLVSKQVSPSLWTLWATS